MLVRNEVKFYPPKEPLLGMTPSLAVLDDASALKKKNGIEVNQVKKCLGCIPL